MQKPKKKGLKISKVKRNNQKRTKLAKQGKLKVQRHRNKSKQFPQNQNVPKPNEPIEEEASDTGEDLMDMIEPEDLKNLKSAFSAKSQSFLQSKDNTRSSRNKRKLRNDESNDFGVENRYEDAVMNMIGDEGEKRLKLLLPVKTKEGIIKKRVIEETISDDAIEEETEFRDEKPEFRDEGPQEMGKESSDDEEPSKINANTKLSTLELLAHREEVLKQRKLKIGLLSSSILENPQLKLNNLRILLKFIDETDPEVCITVKKLAIISLLEIFKDILPSYYINQGKEEGVRYKKETLELKNYEEGLVASYRRYLQRLEKIAGKLRSKKGNTRASSQSEVELGQTAVYSMCQLITAHPYFNFSINIVNFLVPLLDNRREETRKTVFQCFSQIFGNDKRGEITLNIVRKLNQYIKTHSQSINPEIMSVLLHLRIKDINLDDLRKEEVKQKKLVSHKQNVLAYSKRERKKNKKLEAIEKELLETSAVENKAKKLKIHAEIINFVFTIYFRILKQEPNRRILSICLEGLAKFSSCISLEFYQDLVNAINSLMQNNDLGQKEQLYCIQTVFTILSGQAEALSLDPYIFHVHLYRQLLNIHAGKSENNINIIIEILVQVLINRRKRISQGRLLAFVKRIASVALNVQHHAAIGILGIIKPIMQLDTQAHILLDTDCHSGDGVYQPELAEPEYCNAHCTALWELIGLQRHYHSVVQKFSAYIANGVPTNGEAALSFDIAKSTPQELLQNYDPGSGNLKPAIPAPKKSTIPKKIIRHNFNNSEFENYIKEKRRKRSPLIGELMDFYGEIV